METRPYDPASFELLRPEDELRLSRGIEECDIEAWVALLAWPAATCAVLEVVEQRLGPETPPNIELARCAKEALARFSASAKRRLERAARDFSQLVRPLDLDREARRAAVDRVRRLGGTGRAAGPQRPRPERGFAGFLAQVLEHERTGQALRERFVHANLRLVMSVARSYRNSGLPYADLVQEGNLGLIKAVDRFDHRRGTRFSTFAVWWIRHTIGRAVADKATLVRVPVHLSDSRRRIASARGKLAAQLGRRPTLSEVADHLDVPTTRLQQMDKHLPETVMSLDAPLPSDSSSPSWYDSFVETTSDEPDLVQQVVDTTIATRLGGLLSELRDIEADVIRKRFGLDGHDARTLREIAAEYGLSRERIRQIEQAALATLRDWLEPPHLR